ncbi:hypothetical protein [Streptomyces sp. NPDC048332]
MTARKPSRKASEPAPTTIDAPLSAAPAEHADAAAGPATGTLAPVEA